MTLPTLQETITLLITYKYAILFPISILEGPIVTVIAGFLYTLHLMDLLIAYIVVVLGDLTGDTLMYVFGYFGESTVKKYGARLGVTQDRLGEAKKAFTNHHHKTLIASKLVHGIGVSGLVAAGLLKVSYRRYIQTCFYITLLQSSFFLVIGIFFGYTYNKIGTYLDYFAATISTVVLVIIFLVIFFKLKKK